ncbi:DUF1648 domain-containing protein [Streptomyces sp. MNU89]|uniref:DUF1648 domain-containing protein n=1 Tax=Streptomyces sp. MNU89 TaxID=2560025 RepID=UPI001E4678F4|nr:DUF1648 domain-containing protein [Streptomyces sp. MNU89]MCC9742274.1 DUF1648 domain-containing protein [Streptomyces sp. MNU89]
MSDELRPRFPWLWLLPGLVVLLGTTIWGIAVYSGLPERLPQHFGPDGVDAWAEKSVAAAFVPVFVQAGVMVTMAGTAAAILRVRTREEAAAAGPGSAWASLVNRPGSRASALRVAKATLFLGFCTGLTTAAACAVMWRPEARTDVPVLLLPAALLPVLAGTAVLIVVAVRDRSAGGRAGAR